MAAPLSNGTVSHSASDSSSDGASAHENTTVPNGADKSSANARKVKEAERRRRRRKQKKKGKPAIDDGEGSQGSDEDFESETEKAVNQVEVEYVSEKPMFNELNMNPLIQDFLRVFEKFSSAEDMFPVSHKDENMKQDIPFEKTKNSDSDDDDEDEQDTKHKDKGLSNKKKKLQRRMKIAELKQQCSKPDVVEVWDATAADPKLLVFLKAYRNTVPVPRHWCQKRKFLQGKRGIEKQPFQLPDFIAATGIESVRQAYIEKEDSKRLKQKQRERMQPKVGKLDIDYQILHDAFFKYQTKPKLTSHGDLYFEGKEFEVKLKEMKPGHLSQELKEALGMPEGAPPPWLINMQRYGPPPSYPQLKIPGLNSPIPEGASFGYHPGGWGKPPVDEYGRPLYGDVFGIRRQEPEVYDMEPVDRTKHWGDLEEDEEEEEEEEEEEQLGPEELEEGMASVDSLSTTPTGVETPDVIDLRKSQRKEPERSFYQVLEEKEERIGAGTILGTSHTYVLVGADDKAVPKKVDLLKGQRTDKVDITLRPEELEALDDNALAAKFEEAREEEKLRSQREDFSDMVAEAEKKRKRKLQEKEGKSKRQKDFKF